MGDRAHEPQPAGALSVANLGPRQRRKRLRLGAIGLGAGLVLGAVLVALGAARPWRVTLLAPLLLAGLGYFQSRDKT